MSDFIQKIDLYAQLEPPKKKPVATTYMIIGWLTIFVGYVVAAGVLLYDEGTTEKAIALEQGKHRALQSDVNLRLEEDGAINVTHVEAKLETLKRRYNKQKRLADHVRYLSTHGEGHFSEAMIGLARQHVPGVSLQKFNLGNQYKDVSLHGQLGDPKALPRYVSNLGQEAVFRNMTFQRVQVKTEGGLMVFDLSSTVAGTADPNAKDFGS